MEFKKRTLKKKIVFLNYEICMSESVNKMRLILIDNRAG